MDGLDTAPTPPTGAAPSLDPAALLPGLEARKTELETEKQEVKTDLADYSETLATQKAADEARLRDIETQLQKPFEATPPTYNIGSLMKQAPLLMMLAAMGGARGRATGTAGISALNGMVNGLVKGDVQQYQDHEKMYNEQVKIWNDNANHLKAMVSELQRELGSDNAALVRAKQTALRAINGIDTRIDQVDKQYQAVVQGIEKMQLERKKAQEKATTDRARLGIQQVRAAVAAGKATSDDVGRLKKLGDMNVAQQRVVATEIGNLAPGPERDAKTAQLSELQAQQKEIQDIAKEAEKQARTGGDKATAPKAIRYNEKGERIQ